jgi:hypothetical protein
MRVEACCGAPRREAHDAEVSLSMSGNHLFCNRWHILPLPRRLARFRFRKQPSI